MENSTHHVMGHSRRELERLSAQARLFDPLTRRLLTDAGLRPGMRVLDAGAGHGDLSLLAARLVSPGGQVVAVDRSEAAVQSLQQRAEALGLTHLQARQGELSTLGAEAPFDAIIGRLVLMYLPDIPGTLRHLATLLKRGGLLAFQEFDFSGVRSLPEAPTFTRAIGWMTRALEQSGAHLRIGLELRRHFLAAGLPVPTLRLEASLGGGADYLGYSLVAEVLHSLLPVMQKLGVARPEEVEVATLARRLSEEVDSLGGVVVLPSLVGAWARVP